MEDLPAGAQEVDIETVQCQNGELVRTPTTQPETIGGSVVTRTLREVRAHATGAGAVPSSLSEIPRIEPR